MALRTAKLTSKHLQTLLSRIGAAISGTRPTLHSRLSYELSRDGVLHFPPSGRVHQHKLRVISIDMGLKNLAFCSSEVSFTLDTRVFGNMCVTRWEKIDLIQTTQRRTNPEPDVQETRNSGAMGLSKVYDEEVDPFSHCVLSRIAYRLVKDTIIAEKPDVVLIEKQRWRSGGGSAIQQWTVRVNTLEGMLWAVLETLKAERTALPSGPKGKETEKKKAGQYEVFAVDPKRVVHYWLANKEQIQEKGETGQKRRTNSRKLGEKKAKIALLREWLASGPDVSTSTSTANSQVTSPSPRISFEFGTQAQSVRQALDPLQTRKKSTKRASSSSLSSSSSSSPPANSNASLDQGLPNVVEQQLKKLDDVTDCFLQAAAWVSWEMNRLQMQEMLKMVVDGEEEGEEAIGRRSESNGLLNDAVLLRMVKQVD